jgi:hypothetical protein
LFCITLEPYGEFLLDLSVPYDRAVMLEILNICEIDSTIEFNKLEYSESGPSGSFAPLKLVRFDTPVEEFTRHESRELRELRAIELLTSKSWDDIFHAAQRYCSLDPEVLVKTDVERLLKELHVLDIPTVTGEVFFTLDPMEFGEFVESAPYGARRFVQTIQNHGTQCFAPRVELRVCRHPSFTIVVVYGFPVCWILSARVWHTLS